MEKNLKLKIQSIALKRLKAHPQNPRVHPEPDTPEWDALKRSLEHDYFDPIVYNKRNGFLVSGHLRRAVLESLGVEKVDVVVVDYDDPTHIARMIAANRNTGDWEDTTLKALLEQCADPAMAGYTDDEIRLLLDGKTDEASDVDAEPQIDRSEELRKKWGVERGQIWQLGEHRLMCGDSTSEEDVGRLIGGEKADLVITDPPYGMNKAEWDKFIHPKKWLIQCRNISPVVILFSGVKALFDYPRPNWIMCWERRASTQRNGAFKGFNNWEPILVYCVKNISIPNDTFPCPNTEHDTPHPTQKPVKLMVDIISMLDAGIIIDPFSGSGTTLIACERLKRRCRAMEISPGYVAVAIQRWADATNGTPALCK